jgi:hypothetical protein
MTKLKVLVLFFPDFTDSSNMLKDLNFFYMIFLKIIFCMVKYFSFHNSSFSLRYFSTYMARPQCDTTLI